MCIWILENLSRKEKIVWQDCKEIYYKENRYWVYLDAEIQKDDSEDATELSYEQTGTAPYVAQ